MTGDEGVAHRRVLRRRHGSDGEFELRNRLDEDVLTGMREEPHDTEVTFGIGSCGPQRDLPPLRVVGVGAERVLGTKGTVQVRV